MMIQVIDGDITQVECDALATLINSGGLWYGGVDRAIMRVAALHYHAQVGKYLDPMLVVALKDYGIPNLNTELKDGDVWLAVGNRETHQGNFNDVIFVIDDLRQPIAAHIRAILAVAHIKKYKTLAIPAFRCGIMAGKVEPDAATVAQALKDEYQKFLVEAPDFSVQVFVVVYKDTQTVQTFQDVLAR